MNFSKTAKILLYTGMITICILFMFPFFWMFISALKRPEELSVAISFFPKEPQWIHFYQILTNDRDCCHFFPGLQNTLIICAIVTVITCISSAMVGYGFARFNAPGRNSLFMILLGTMMLPGILTMIPHYIIFSQLGILSLPWPFCYLPWLITSIPGWGLFIFFYRQFFAGLPKELEDAAVIDGCGRIRTFWQIFMPLAGPAITTVCIFLFQWTYTDYVGPLLYLTSDNQTLAVIMMSQTGIPGVSFTQPIPPVPYQMTVGILFTIPLICLFFAAQKYFYKGIATSGLKG